MSNKVASLNQEEPAPKPVAYTMNDAVSGKEYDPATDKSTNNLVENAVPQMSVEEKAENEEEPSCLERFFMSRPVALVIYFVTGGYGLFTVVSDWFLTRDLVVGKSGLVFGPPPVGIQVAMLIFTIFGTLAYICEMANLTREVFFGVETVDDDLAQSIGLFFQEVPQITVNMYVAACREVAVSVFQLIKASLGMVGALIRVLVLICHFFSKKKRNVMSWIERTAILVCALYVLAGSITVFTFIYTRPPGEGGGFKVPKTIVRSTIDEGKYLLNTSIYFSHPSFALCNGNQRPWNDQSINWIKIASVYQVKESQVRFVYDSRPNNESMVYVRFERPPNLTCYQVTNLCEVRPSVCGTPRNLDTFYFSLRYRARTQTIPLGDVRVNAKRHFNSSCNQLHRIHTGYFTEDRKVNLAQMHYFRSENDVDVSFLPVGGSMFRFYKIDQDMKNVTQVWRTGYQKCKMSGSLAPNGDTKVPASCVISS